MGCSRKKRKQRQHLFFPTARVALWRKTVLLYLALNLSISGGIGFQLNAEEIFGSGSIFSSEKLADHLHIDT
jgi:hypothetical protein